jgi:hypothetical protein
MSLQQNEGVINLVMNDKAEEGEICTKEWGKYQENTPPSSPKKKYTKRYKKQNTNKNKRFKHSRSRSRSRSSSNNNSRNESRRSKSRSRSRSRSKTWKNKQKKTHRNNQQRNNQIDNRPVKQNGFFNHNQQPKRPPLYSRIEQIDNNIKDIKAMLFDLLNMNHFQSQVQQQQYFLPRQL